MTTYSGIWEKTTMKDIHADVLRKAHLMNYLFYPKPLNLFPFTPTPLLPIVRSVTLHTSNDTAQNTPAPTVGPPPQDTTPNRCPKKDLPEILVEEDN